MRVSRVPHLLAGLSLSVAVFAGAAADDDGITKDDLITFEQRLETERAKLKALQDAQNSARQDLSGVNKQLLAAAQESRRREETAALVERELVELRVRENEARDLLMSDREGLKDVLEALVHSSRRRPPALVTHPDRATDAIQAAIVMRDLADQLEIRSTELAAKVREYATLAEKVEKEKARLDTAEERLSEKNSEIQQLAAVKRAAFEDVTGETEDLERRVAALAERTETLRALLAEIEANAPVPPSRKPSILTSPKDSGPDEPIAVAVLSRLGLPAMGKIIRGYGDNLQSGRKAEGITVLTRASAQVIAPADGEVVWSGPFRSYGQMLILRTGDGYHIVLSGLASIYSARGQTVSAGEPIGQMSERQDLPAELYMELRKNGTPEDPARWMVQSRG